MNIHLLQFYYGAANCSSDFFAALAESFGKTLVADNHQLAK